MKLAAVKWDEWQGDGEAVGDTRKNRDGRLAAHVSKLRHDTARHQKTRKIRSRDRKREIIEAMDRKMKKKRRASSGRGCG